MSEKSLAKELGLYPVGTYIKIRLNRRLQEWYIPDILRIKGYEYNRKKELIYTIDITLKNVDFDGKSISSKASIHPAHIYIDNECIRLNRLTKLSKL